MLHFTGHIMKFSLVVFLLVTILLSECSASIPSCSGVWPADKKFFTVRLTVWGSANNLIASTKVYPPSYSNLLHALQIAKLADPRFTFETLKVDGGSSVYKINGTVGLDKSGKNYWGVYRTVGTPNVAKPPGPERQRPQALEKTILRDGDNILFWLQMPKK